MAYLQILSKLFHILSLHIINNTESSVIFILGYSDDVRDFLLRAEAEDMLNGYVWVGVDILGWVIIILPEYLNILDNFA